MVFDVVLGSDLQRRTTGAIGVNEDEFADFLDNGRRASGPRDESTRDTATRFRDLLGSDAVWAEPSPTGVDDLLAAIEAESGDTAPTVAPATRPRAPSRGRSRRLILVAAAAGIVVVAGVVGILVRSAGDGARPDVPAGGPRAAP